MDACESSSGYETAARAFIEEDKDQRESSGEKVLFIGTDGEEVETPKLGHGVLTKVVLDGLAGDADYDENGIVSATELEAFMYCGSMKYRQTFKVSPRTTRTGGDFILAFTDKGVEFNMAAAKAKASATNALPAASRRCWRDSAAATGDASRPASGTRMIRSPLARTIF